MKWVFSLPWKMESDSLFWLEEKGHYTGSRKRKQRSPVKLMTRSLNRKHSSTYITTSHHKRLHLCSTFVMFCNSLLHRVCCCTSTLVLRNVLIKQAATALSWPCVRTCSIIHQIDVCLSLLFCDRHFWVEVIFPHGVRDDSTGVIFFRDMPYMMRETL